MSEQTPAPASALRGRRAAATAILVLLGAILICWLSLLLEPSLDSAAVTPLFFLGGVGLSLYALWAPTFWGRWLVQGLAVGGIVQLALLAFFLGPWWLIIGLPVVVLLGALLLLLRGRRMSEVYERNHSPSNGWNLEVRSVRVLAASVVLNIGAVPMLLIYAGSEAWWIGPGRRIATLVVLGSLVLAIVLTILQRTAGLLLMALAGAATVFVGADALFWALGPSPPALDRVNCSMSLKEIALAGSLPAIAASIPGALSSIAAISAFARGIGGYLRRS